MPIPGAPGPAAPTPGQPGVGGPSASPMMTPQKPEGKIAAGKVKVQVAIHALQLAMQDVGISTDDGQAILEALSKLTKKFGKHEEESKSLMPAELMQVMQQKAGPGAPPPGAPPPQGAAPPGGPPPGAMPQAA